VTALPPHDQERRFAERELERVATALSRAEGRREALRLRAEALEREIALAKGRLALREEVENFIHEVQQEASRRNVASFETLLTALVREVLPGEKPVALELTTERGLASLDICVARPDGSREDVLEDNGGALTNVIGMALRLIAVVKADVGRFLALDEADCWIAPERVPSFYRVLEDSAARLGVQCLAISHHDLSRFEGRLRVSRITGDPATGVGIACPDSDASWDDQAPGLRFIRLVDVQGYKDATLTLGPGVNALIGPNNRGKSTVIRALRAVFYGEARDSLVRAGANAAKIEIGVERGRTLRFSRQPRRTPVNLWSLHERDGSIVEEHGMRYETGGRSVPDWVEELFGITKVEELDVHIAHQKFPVFLLGEPASRRSAVLSIGQEASYVRDMLVLHRERCTRDMALVRNGERELATIAEAMVALEDVPSIADAIASARTLASDIEQATKKLHRIEERRAALATASTRLQLARAKLDVFEDLPGSERFSDIQSRVERSNERGRIGQRVLDLARSLELARARLTALAELPSVPPILASTASAENIGARLKALRQEADRAAQRLADAETQMHAVRSEMERLVEETGGLCPACGAPVEPEALLTGHAHPKQEAA